MTPGMQAATLSITRTDLVGHKTFLKLIHTVGGDSLYETENLKQAIVRYEHFWLPLLNKYPDKTNLVPPVDIAWAWHCHRLSPKNYRDHCMKVYGRTLAPEQAVFKVAARYDTSIEAVRKTMELWYQEYDRGFFPRRAISDEPKAKRMKFMNHIHGEAGEQFSNRSELKYNIIAASTRQRPFLWQLMRPSFDNPKFLDEAIKRYRKFLKLMKVHGYHKHTFVPTQDIDFCWHTHMLKNTETYLSETLKLAGAEVDHDDTTPHRNQTSTLDSSWQNTQQLWKASFNDSLEIADGAADDRGEPPTWWYQTDASKIIKSESEFLSKATINSLLEQLPMRAAKSNIQGKKQLQFEVSLSPGIYYALLHTVCSPKIMIAPQKVPVKISTSSVSLRARRHAGYQESDNRWLCLVYLKGAGRLILHDQVTSKSHDINITAGQLIAFPKIRFKHEYDAKRDNGELRVLLGPMAYDPESQKLVYIGTEAAKESDGDKAAEITAASASRCSDCLSKSGVDKGNEPTGRPEICADHLWGTHGHLWYYYVDSSSGSPVHMRRPRKDGSLKHAGCCTIA